MEEPSCAMARLAWIASEGRFRNRLSEGKQWYRRSPNPTRVGNDGWTLRTLFATPRVTPAWRHSVHRTDQLPSCR